eukprot:TRINITY_DN3978_c0_g1_i1.p1 TRINITY_DN3978_c0_g1~~TRINITY_DN3978_c0_g1_i1.p1  ORF type:complete len:246 (+),score=46.22 TRINITY_DN3978_c0_g1_i1:80-817(+)
MCIRDRYMGTSPSKSEIAQAPAVSNNSPNITSFVVGEKIDAPSIILAENGETDTKVAANARSESSIKMSEEVVVIPNGQGSAFENQKSNSNSNSFHKIEAQKSQSSMYFPTDPFVFKPPNDAHVRSPTKVMSNGSASKLQINEDDEPTRFPSIIMNSLPTNTFPSHDEMMDFAPESSQANNVLKEVGEDRSVNNNKVEEIKKMKEDDEEDEENYEEAEKKEKETKDKEKKGEFSSSFFNKWYVDQ